MNLQRKILEALDEKEFTVKPEFQEKPDELTAGQVHNMLMSLGWAQVSSGPFGYKGYMNYRQYEYPGAASYIVIHMSYYSKTDEVNAIRFVATYNGDMKKIPPTLESVKKATDTARATIKKVPKGGGALASTEKKLGDLGFYEADGAYTIDGDDDEIMSSAWFHDDLPGVQITLWETGEMVGSDWEGSNHIKTAYIEYQGGGFKKITPLNVVPMAKKLLSKVSLETWSAPKRYTWHGPGMNDQILGTRVHYVWEDQDNKTMVGVLTEDTGEPILNVSYPLSNITPDDWGPALSSIVDSYMAVYVYDVPEASKGWFESLINTGAVENAFPVGMGSEPGGSWENFSTAAGFDQEAAQMLHAMQHPEDEGITEKEFKIKPEFQASPGIKTIEHAFYTNGWKMSIGTVMPNNTYKRSWVNDDLADVNVNVTYKEDTDEVIGGLEVELGGDDPYEIPATVESIKKLTVDLTQLATAGKYGGVAELSEENEEKIAKLYTIKAASSSGTDVEYNTPLVVWPVKGYTTDYVYEFLFADLESLNTEWSKILEGWLVWPANDANNEGFNDDVGYMLSRLDELFKNLGGDVTLANNVKKKILYSQWASVEDDDEPINRENGVTFYVSEDPPQVTMDEIEKAMIESGLTWSFTYDDMFWKVWPQHGQGDASFNAAVSLLLSRVDSIVHQYGENAPGSEQATASQAMPWVMGDELTTFVKGTPFLHVVYPDMPITEDNPVMILRKQLKSVHYSDYVSDLLAAQMWLEWTYDDDFQVWKLWPVKGISEPTFKMYLKGIGYKLS